MNSPPELRLDWCTHTAARFAVERWHYSQAMPAGKMNAVGVWEHGRYIGCVLFSRGANNNIGKPYGLDQTQICELTRVALTTHAAPVSRILRIAFLFLRKKSPGLRLCISYADPEQGHAGGIYQAGNWLYSGKSQPQAQVIVNGQVMHKRSATALFGTIKGLEKSPVLWKHRYLLALDAEMRKKIEPLRLPYPRAGGDTQDTPANHAGEGGSLPTPALHSEP